MKRMSLDHMVIEPVGLSFHRNITGFGGCETFHSADLIMNRNKKFSYITCTTTGLVWLVTNHLPWRNWLGELHNPVVDDNILISTARSTVIHR